MKKFFFAVVTAMFLMSSCSGGNAVEKAFSNYESAIEKMEKANDSEDFMAASEAMEKAVEELSSEEVENVVKSLPADEREALAKRARELMEKAASVVMEKASLGLE